MLDLQSLLEILDERQELALFLDPATLAYLYHVTERPVFLEGTVFWLVFSTIGFIGLTETQSGRRSSARTDTKPALYLLSTIFSFVGGGVTALLAAWNNLVGDELVIEVFSIGLVRFFLGSNYEWMMYPEIVYSYTASPDLILTVLFVSVLVSKLLLILPVVVHVTAAILDSIVGLLPQIE